MTQAILIYFICFFSYHFIMHSYSASILKYNSNWLYPATITALINASFWTYYTLYLSLRFEPLALSIYALILFFEFKIVYRANNDKAVFAAFSFTVNIFSKRFAAIGILALIQDDIMMNIATDTQSRLIISAASFAVSVSTIFVAKKLLPSQYMDMILADRKNLSFASNVTTAIFILLVVLSMTMGAPTTQNNIKFIFVLVGGSGIMGYGIVMFYAYIFSQLKIYVTKYENLSNTLSSEKLAIKSLEDEYTTDPLTGLRTRDVAINQINKYLEEKATFYITFIDMDGLKSVNDKYGHSEGDFYIKSVAESLLSYFSDDIISRYGGDEFLIVGEYPDEYLPAMKTMGCYQNIIELSNKYDLSYQTSASYGWVKVDHSNKLSVTELIKIADSRMYEVKKTRKNARHTAISGKKG